MYYNYSVFIAAQRAKQQFIILTYDIVFGEKSRFTLLHLTAQLDHTASRALQPEYFAAFGFIPRSGVCECYNR